MSEDLNKGTEYNEALDAMSTGNESAKTKVAFYKLSGCGGASVDVKEAVALLEERSEKGDGEAKWMLGLCCEYGMGMEQDIERAESLYRESSEARNEVGGFLMNNGKGKRGSGVMTAGMSLWKIMKIVF